MQRHDDNLAARINGNALQPLQGASVSVTNDATGLPATLYSDNGVTQLAQPLTTGNEGQYGFYAADGKYTLTFSGTRFTTFTRKLILEDPLDNPYATQAALAVSSGAGMVGYGARKVSDLLGDTANPFNTMTLAQIDDVKTRTASLDVVAEIQAVIDATTGPLTVELPAGTYKFGSTLYLRRSKVRIIGKGPGVTLIKYVNAAGGIVFSGDVNTSNSLNTYSSCEIANLEVISSGDPTTDASIVVDLTSFSYSHFNIEAQTKRTNACIYYGQGNNGQSPYFNHIESTGLFGGTASGTGYTQDAFRFLGGAWAGGSNGPNANMIGPITRAAALKNVVDLRVGLQNMFSNVNAESIVGNYFILGGNAAVQTGTSSGANGQISIKDTAKAWVANAYVNGAVQITGGTGAGQIRVIKTNTETQIEVHEPWATIPDTTSQYSVFEGKVHGNKFVNIRGEGLASANPSFIYAYPGSDLTEFSNVDISSLGTGQYLWDYTGSARNSFYGNAKVSYTHTFVTPGPSANINAYPRVSVFGGVKPAGEYVVEWMKVAPQYFSNGAAMTVTLDVGGSAVGGGTQTLTVVIPDGNDVGMAFPKPDQKLMRNGTNNSVYLNLQTAAGFTTSYSVVVTWCITLK